MGLNCLGSVVRGLFATGVTIARRQSSETWAVWSERLNIRASTGAMWETFEDLKEKLIRANAVFEREGSLEHA